MKKQGVDGTFYSETERVDTLEKTESIRSSKDGKWSLDMAPKSGGVYLVRALYTGKNGKTTSAETTVYVETENYVNWNDGNNSIARLTPENHLLAPGQTAVLTLESPVNTGKMLVLIEKDDVIFESYVRDITSFAEKIEIPIKAEHIPNLYVRVFLIGKNGDLPVYKRALASLKVLPDTKKLSVSVKTDKVSYLPGEGLSVNIEVKDANGTPVSGADGSLTVVDQSVLALLGNPVKNPFAFFYDMKRYLGTVLYSSLVNLVEKLEIKNVNNGEKGGAGEGNKGGDSKKKRGNFKDTAFYRANFTTDAQGKAKIDTGVLPDNLTTWEIESIVSTKTTQIGIGNTQITTQKKVMIQENLPRILRTGDTLSLLPVVFNRTGKESEMEVTLSGSGFSGGALKKITLKDGESRSLEFEIRANPLASASTLEYATIVFSAKSLTTKEEDTVEKTLPVVRGETWESTATIGSTSNESFDERLLLGDIPKDRAKLSIHYSMSLFGNALDGLEHLMRYPYGCIEQKTSAILPIALTKNLSEALGRSYDIDTPVLDYYDPTTYTLKKKSLRNALESYFTSLMTHERTSGGLGYWSDSSGTDLRMTSYVVRQIPEIIRTGVSIDEAFLSRMTSYLKTRFYTGTYEGCIIKYPKECDITRSDKLQIVRAFVHAKKTDID